eukprot:scaffold9634_cov96-Isochrysis_galbana.AAC.1
MVGGEAPLGWARAAAKGCKARLQEGGAGSRAKGEQGRLEEEREKRAGETRERKTRTGKTRTGKTRTGKTRTGRTRTGKTRRGKKRKGRLPGRISVRQEEGGACWVCPHGLVGASASMACIRGVHPLESFSSTPALASSSSRATPCEQRRAAMARAGPRPSREARGEAPR